ncbi:hypothetical protein [Chitinophaga qingshengii]|uniref:Uncharacterized protein n=1 Tax=Chitinophaga qingshengii TaxID=1569794 RepID=A0ABR7TYG4_9BACT|nr:hypothetical protein [Chitinophaga qingshengii]MBC9934840.1 hypothetical protein [Chitinophaga qingshengii]
MVLVFGWASTYNKQKRVVAARSTLGVSPFILSCYQKFYWVNAGISMNSYHAKIKRQLYKEPVTQAI